MQRISIGRALLAVPYVSPADWRGSSLLVRWLISARASVLVMTCGSAALGGLLALPSPQWDTLAWLGCLVGLLLAHAANNQLNDLTDSIRGVDEGNYFRLRYGTHVLEQGLLNRRELWMYIALTGGLAALVGVWLVLRVGTGLLIPFLLGSFFVVFYTWPLKQWGLGELSVWLVWGPLMVGGTGWAAAGVWDWQIAVIGGLFALGPTTVIFGKHIDKLDFDRDKGIATLPVRLGAVRARGWVRGMLVGLYLGSVVLVVVQWLPIWTLLTALALPKAFRMYRIFCAAAPADPPLDYAADVWPLWYAAAAFDHTRWFTVLFVTGLCLERV